VAPAQGGWPRIWGRASRLIRPSPRNHKMAPPPPPPLSCAGPSPSQPGFVFRARNAADRPGVGQAVRWARQGAIAPTTLTMHPEFHSVVIENKPLTVSCVPPPPPAPPIPSTQNTHTHGAAGMVAATDGFCRRLTAPCAQPGTPTARRLSSGPGRAPHRRGAAQLQRAGGHYSVRDHVARAR
jgi:hypothetical protein